VIVQVICDDCNGTGISEYVSHGPTEADVEPIRCPACGGFGAVETADSVVAAWNKAVETAASLADAEAPNVAAAIRAIAQPEDDMMPPVRAATPPLSDQHIKRMVDRFLGWRLPENFRPDGGISFKPTFNDHLPQPMKHEPSGTNLFDATQAEAMVRHMVEGITTETAA
jgi:hypothetical protein